MKTPTSPGSTALILSTLCFMVFGLSVGAGLAAAQDNASDKTVIAPNDKDLLYVGRWDRQLPTNSHGNWIAAYVRTVFTGTSVALRVGGYSKIVYVIDGQPPQITAGGPGVVPLNPTPLSDGTHTLLVGVHGGGGWDFQGLVLDGGAALQPPAPRPILEFVGDSITCGSPAPIEAAGNYSWLTADALGCDHTQISWPGRALTTHFGCQGDKVGLDIQYFQQNCFYDSPKAPWDFSTYTPRMLIINLGQNDACGNEPDATFLASYTSFLTNIRAKLPLATLVCLRPFSGNYAASVSAAVDALNQRGDANVHFVDTTGWLENLADFADGIHPNVVGHQKVAQHLIPLLKDFARTPVTSSVNAPAPTTVGEPGNPGALSGELLDAYNNGARDIIIRPGLYQIPDAHHPVFPLMKWEYATITAPGCIFEDQGSNDVFNLSECRHVTLRGPLIARHSVPCGTQGRITAISQDPDGKPTCDWQVDAGYGTNTTGFDNFDVVRQENRHLGACDLRNFKIEPLGDTQFRIHWSFATFPGRVNDWLVHRYHAPGCAVRVSNSRDCTIDGVTSQNGGHATFFEADGSGGDHFLNCGIACGPKPEGATEEQLVSNWADGLHSIGTFPGPDIENFTDSGNILDDCIAIRGNFSGVLSSDPADKTITLDSAPDWLIKVGEPVRVVNHTYYAEANVTAIKDQNGKKVLTLDQALTVPVPADCVDPLRCGAYYQIVNCHIGGTRSRGIIAKADGGMIRNTSVAYCGTGIRLGPGGGEAGYFQSNTVVDNDVSHCREVGMTFEANTHKALRDVRIFRNHFEANASDDGDLRLFLLHGAMVSFNIFTPPSSWPQKPRPPLTIEYCRNVTISQNQIENPDGYATPLLQIGVDVDHLKQDVTTGTP